MRAFLLRAAVATAIALLVAPAAHAARPAKLKVRACEAGSDAADRRATFYARMRVVPGTDRMQMRFTLLDRSLAGSNLVRAPQLARWRRSRPGVRKFGYAQTVTGLRPGGVYSVVVEYRWLDADGETIMTRRRTSSDCRQDGDLPNLAVTGVSVRPGAALGTQRYGLEVENRGTAPALEFDVELFVDSIAADTERIHEVEPGETVTVWITAPQCLGRIRAVADSGDRLAEATEDDNTLRSRCPEPG
jgi:CARDB